MDMNKLQWDPKKSELLKRIRGISFEEIILCREVDIIQNPNRPNQSYILYECENYIWAVPFVRTEEGFFLKTLYPCRKYTKIYLEGIR